MIRRFIKTRVAYWHGEYVSHAKASHLLGGTPIGSHADFYASRARKRLRLWENLLFVISTPQESA